jgi:hypothetical protein
MNNRKRDKGKIEGPFVPLLIDTMKAPAWRVMSSNARVLYIALKARYSVNAKNNGRIYLSGRVAAEETGLARTILQRCFRELQYYGFIVMTEPGCLGVNGKGKAPHWRLTELGYMLDPPTRDFMRWDGERFHEQKSPEHYKRLARFTAARKTESRPHVRSTVAARQVHTSGRTCGHLSAEVAARQVHTADPPRPHVKAISDEAERSAANGDLRGMPRDLTPRLLPWSTPHIELLEGVKPEDVE